MAYREACTEIWPALVLLQSGLGGLLDQRILTERLSEAVKQISTVLWTERQLSLLRPHREMVARVRLNDATDDPRRKR